MYLTTLKKTCYTQTIEDILLNPVRSIYHPEEVKINVPRMYKFIKNCMNGVG